MFETDKVIFLELRKTGTSQIRHLLEKCVGGKADGYHNSLTDFNTNKFILSTIRNPWEWYISLWAFGCEDKGYIRYILSSRNKNPKLTDFIKEQIGILKKDGFSLRAINKIMNNHIIRFQSGSRKCWDEVYSDSQNPENFRKWIKYVLSSKKNQLPRDYSDCSISKFGGFMTFLYCKMHHKDFLHNDNFYRIHSLEELKQFDKKNNIVQYMIRNESIEDDFLKALEKAGYKITKTMTEIVDSSKRIHPSKRRNSSKHKSADFYYDKETADLVYEKDTFIIEKYNYDNPIHEKKK